MYVFYSWARLATSGCTVGIANEIHVGRLGVVAEVRFHVFLVVQGGHSPPSVSSQEGRFNEGLCVRHCLLFYRCVCVLAKLAPLFALYAAS